MPQQPEPKRWEEPQAAMYEGYASKSVNAAHDGEGFQIDVPIQKRRAALSSAAKFAYFCAGVLLNVMSAFVVWFDARDRTDAYAKLALKMSFAGACLNTVLLIIVIVSLHLKGLLF